MTNPIFQGLKIPGKTSEHKLPKPELSTLEVDKLIQQSASIGAPREKPNGQLTWTENAILFLSGHCDGAHSRDDVGFNGGHAYLGNEFAKQIQAGKRLTSKQLDIAHSYLPTYLNTQLKGFVTKQQLEADRATWPVAALTAKQRVENGEVSQADVEFFVKNYQSQLVDDKNKSFVQSLTSKWPHVSERQLYWLKIMSLEQAHTIKADAVRPPSISFVTSVDKDKLDIPFNSTVAKEITNGIPGDSTKSNASGSERGDRSVGPLQESKPASANPFVAIATARANGANESPKGNNPFVSLATKNARAGGNITPVSEPNTDGKIEGTNNPFRPLRTGAGTRTEVSRQAVVATNSPALTANQGLNMLELVNLARPPVRATNELAQNADNSKEGVDALVSDGQRTVNLLAQAALVSETNGLATSAATPVVITNKIIIRRGGKDIELIPDPSQLAATQGLKHQKYGCLTGAAGTGKTTVELILLKNIEDQAGEIEVDLNSYGKAGTIVSEEEYQDYKATGEVPNKKRPMPAVACAAYTGKAMQQMKRALPESYHSRCFTIHKLLGFHPIFVDKEINDPDRIGRMKVITVRKFVPFYDASNKLPWKVIVIDEGSMVPIALWNQLLAACTEDCRIMIIGDINQLPPVHGRSVFGFAMLKWPSYELTQIHRQKGEDNPIVDNAWRILNGKLPVAVPGKVDMIRLPSDEFSAFNTLVKAAVLLNKKGEFNPADADDVRGDMIVVPQNKGLLGQPEVNNKLLGYFNPPPAEHSEVKAGRRQVIIAGFEKKFFAVGDKVMVTVNDHEVGVTNGMTGRVIDIARNGNFSGVGTKSLHMTPEKIEELLANIGEIDLSAEQREHHAAGDDDNFKKRAASHIVTVDFGVNEDGERIEVAFDTTGGVNSLIHAYAATCHKLQGSECPTIIILCHSKNHRMLYREWLYTAFTRAIQRVILLYDDKGLSLAVNRQKIKGRNLKEKAQAFIELNESGDATLPDLPEAETL